MPKFLAGCRYNEKEISRHLGEKNIGYCPVQNNGNKFASGQILKKPVEVVKGADFSWLSSKVSQTLLQLSWEIGHEFNRSNLALIKTSTNKPLDLTTTTSIQSCRLMWWNRCE